MLGGIFEINSEYHYDKTLRIWNKDKSDSLGFKEHQVQRMTPVKFGENYIGIGDKIIVSRNGFEYTVIEYSYDEEGINVSGISENKKVYYFGIREITSYTPLYPNKKIELTDEQLVEELKKRGLLENGKILKA